MENICTSPYANLLTYSAGKLKKREYLCDEGLEVAPSQHVLAGPPTGPGQVLMEK